MLLRDLLAGCGFHLVASYQPSPCQEIRTDGFPFKKNKQNQNQSPKNQKLQILIFVTLFIKALKATDTLGNQSFSVKKKTKKQKNSTHEPDLMKAVCKSL